MREAFRIRPLRQSDLNSIAVIQRASPEASQWECGDYLLYETRVAETDEEVTGFLAYRTVAPDEHELLNLAVAREWRRRGIGRALIEAVLEEAPGTWFLEVRESNRASREFYKILGFTEITVRHSYYNNPSESGIVMRFLS